MKHFLDKRHLVLLYNSYLQSALDYGSILFTNVNKTTLKPIITLQKKAIRIICSVGFREHTAVLFKTEKILCFEDSIKYNICRFMFDYSNRLLPTIFRGTWQKNSDIHTHTTRNKNNFYIVNFNKNDLNKFPLYHFPKAWNSLPDSIKGINSRTLFARKLYDYLIENIETD